MQNLLQSKMLVVFSRSKKKKKKKSQDCEEKISQCCQSLTIWRWNSDSWSKFETFADYLKELQVWWVGVAFKLPSRLCVQYRWLWFLILNWVQFKSLGGVSYQELKRYKWTWWNLSTDLVSFTRQLLRLQQVVSPEAPNKGIYTAIRWSTWAEPPEDSYWSLSGGMFFPQVLVPK